MLVQDRVDSVSVAEAVGSLAVLEPLYLCHRALKGKAIREQHSKCDFRAFRKCFIHEH